MSNVRVVCCESGCRSGRSKTSNLSLSLHEFPLNNPDLLKKWLANLNRKDFEPNANSRICSLHFAPEDFLVQIQQNTKSAPPVFVRQLKRNAVPNLVKNRKIWELKDLEAEEDPPPDAESVRSSLKKKKVFFSETSRSFERAEEHSTAEPEGTAVSMNNNRPTTEENFDTRFKKVLRKHGKLPMVKPTSPPELVPKLKVVAQSRNKLEKKFPGRKRHRKIPAYPDVQAASSPLVEDGPTITRISAAYEEPIQPLVDISPTICTAAYREPAQPEPLIGTLPIIHKNFKDLADLENQLRASTEMPEDMCIIRKNRVILLLLVDANEKNFIPKLRASIRIEKGFLYYVVLDNKAVPKSKFADIAKTRLENLPKVLNLISAVKELMVIDDLKLPWLKMAQECLQNFVNDSSTDEPEKLLKKTKFVLEQLQLAKVERSGHQYSPKMISFAFWLYAFSRQVYRQLLEQDLLTLPSERYLSRVRKSVGLGYGMGHGSDPTASWNEPSDNDLEEEVPKRRKRGSVQSVLAKRQEAAYKYSQDRLVRYVPVGRLGEIRISSHQQIHIPTTAPTHVKTKTQREQGDVDSETDMASKTIESLVEFDVA